jgi:hypothetical protein
MRTVLKVPGLTLLLRVGTSRRRGEGLFFEVPPLASYALLTTLHPLLESFRRMEKQVYLSPQSFQTALVVDPPS